MPRKLYPTIRLDPFHKLLEMISYNENKVKNFKKIFDQREASALNKEKNLSKILKLAQEGKIKVKRGYTFIDGYKFFSVIPTASKDPSLPKADLKDIKFLKSIFRKVNYVQDVEMEKKDILSFYFVKIIANFEFYISSISKELSYKHKAFFKDEKELHKFIKFDLKEQIKLLRSKNLGFPYIISRTEKAVEYITTRNLLLHNNGIVNYYYINSVKNTKRKMGEIINIDYRYLLDSCRFFIYFSRSIDDIFTQKVLKIKYRKIRKISSEALKHRKALLKYLKTKPTQKVK